MDSQELVERVAELVSLPEVCLRVNEMLADANVTSAQVGRVIRLDPALTARLLKIVNSAFYGFPSRIDTVTQAVTIIGLSELRALVVASSAYIAFKSIPTDLVDMDSFWHHSVYTGLVARNLAPQCGIPGREAAFLSGLLHDVGHLVIYSQLPDEACRIIEQTDAADRSSCAVERDVLGFDHAQVGAELMQQWGLPQDLWEPVRFHHEPAAAENYAKDAGLIHVANAIAATVEPLRKSSAAPGSETPRVDPLAWEMTGLTSDVVEPVTRAVNLELLDVLETICPRSAAVA